MSAITRITKTQIVEREFLIKALEDLGYAWKATGGILSMGPKENIKVKGMSARFQKTGEYYSFITRGTRSTVSRNIQQDLKQITQRYIYHVARAKLEAQGFTLAQEEVQQGGRIHLVLRRMA